ncbi:hypothetical protein MRX96_041919 [Rhipicephalus microplus]
MDPRLHQGWREARAEALELTYAHKNTTYYVDAANYDHANNKAVATVVNHTLTERTSASVRCRNITDAEETVIALALALGYRQRRSLTVLTDSQAACRNYLQGSRRRPSFPTRGKATLYATSPLTNRVRESKDTKNRSCQLSVEKEGLGRISNQTRDSSGRYQEPPAATLTLHASPSPFSAFFLFGEFEQGRVDTLALPHEQPEKDCGIAGKIRSPFYCTRDFM